MFESPPPLLPPPLVDPLSTWPSLGCTSTQPAPWKPIWSVSPEPRPIKVFRFASVFTCVCRPLDQVIAAWGSQNVGTAPVSRRTGGPSETTATQPVPESDMLYSPPASIDPIPPSAFLMSQSMSESNARTLRPL